VLPFWLFLIYQSSSTPAEDPLKLDECRLAGKYLLELLKMDLKPRDIITEKSLRNAIVIIMALGGSTNAVLHLIAIARWVITFIATF
jgi:dihydroxy-acid dehydratase